MILWLILTLAVLAQCEQPRCPDSCSCSFSSNSSVEVECSQISLTDFHSLPPNTTLLSIQSSNLTNLSSAHLSSLLSLTKLKLHHNNLTSLPADLLHGLPLLHTLDLTGNQVANLPPAVFALESLKHVVLKNNLIQEVDSDWFSFNSSVTQLDLSENVLSKVPERSFFQRFPHLEHLYLNSNDLQELPEDTLKDLQNLTVLNLMKNKLTALHPATFSHNTKLILMFLHDNHLRELPVTLLNGLTKLSMLMISDNQLRNLPEGLLDGTGPSFSIILYGNPWQCDEKLKYLWKWMKTNTNKVLYRGNVGCDGPPNLKNELVLIVRENELKPVNTT